MPPAPPLASPPTHGSLSTSGMRQLILARTPKKVGGIYRRTEPYGCAELHAMPRVPACHAGLTTNPPSSPAGAYISRFEHQPLAAQTGAVYRRRPTLYVAPSLPPLFTRTLGAAADFVVPISPRRALFYAHFFSHSPREVKLFCNTTAISSGRPKAVYTSAREHADGPQSSQKSNPAASHPPRKVYTSKTKRFYEQPSLDTTRRVR